MNRAHQCSSSAAGPLIVFEPCNNVTTRGQVSVLSNPIITQKDWYTPPPEWKHHKKVIPFRCHSCEFTSVLTSTSSYILSFLSQFNSLRGCTQTLIRVLQLLNPSPWLKMNKDTLKTLLCMNLGASQVQELSNGLEGVGSSFHNVTFDIFHTSSMGEWVENMKHITGWTETRALQQQCAFV